MRTKLFTDSSVQYKTRLGKQESRSFHRPALQIPANIEIRFTKVRSAKKKKDKTGRRLGRGGNVGENLRRTGDLSLRDTSNYVLWEFSVSFRCSRYFVHYNPLATGRTPTHHREFWNGKYTRQLLSEKKREG